ncbi:MAG: accessory factor UbiK family protein [Gemmobacter sp.]
MQTRNKFLDDMSQLFTNALGVAQGARTEAETAMRGMIDRWLAERDLATREEIDALREMVLKSRAETEALAARVAALEAAAAPAAPKRARRAAPKG